MEVLELAVIPATAKAAIILAAMSVRAVGGPVNNIIQKIVKKLLLILPIVGLAAVSCNVQKQQSTNLQKQNATQQVNDFDLQTKCADRAAKYYADKGYKDGDGITFDYTNHYNSKLNKCFILIKSYTAVGDNLAIDLYDASEGKHYAEFDGHSLCDNIALSISGDYKKCQIDSGNIWFDGNDTKNPADFHVGFGGLIHGGIGDENTQKQFLEHVQPFMVE